MFVTSFVYGQNDTLLSDNWNNFSNETYSFTYPARWELDQDGLKGTEFLLFSPLLGTEDTFRENINLVKQDISGYFLDLEEYTKLTIGQVETILEDGKIMESRQMFEKNKNYQKLIFTGTQNKRPLKFEQYFWLQGDVAYILTFTAENQQFEFYRILAEKVLHSFELK